MSSKMSPNVRLALAPSRRGSLHDYWKWAAVTARARLPLCVRTTAFLNLGATAEGLLPATDLRAMTARATSKDDDVGDCRDVVEAQLVGLDPPP